MPEELGALAAAGDAALWYGMKLLSLLFCICTREMFCCSCSLSLERRFFWWSLRSVENFFGWKHFSGELKVELRDKSWSLRLDGALIGESSESQTSSSGSWVSAIISNESFPLIGLLPLVFGCGVYEDKFSAFSRLDDGPAGMAGSMWTLGVFSVALFVGGMSFMSLMAPALVLGVSRLVWLLLAWLTCFFESLRIRDIFSLSMANFKHVGYF